MYKIVICAIMKNEERYINEWLGFHILQGVEKFYLYDHESDDTTISTIMNGPFSSYVNIINWNYRPGQLLAYKHYIEKFRQEAEWVAFIDVDEFICPVNNLVFTEMLPRFESFSGLLLNWLVFGCDGHITRPLGLVIDNYRKHMPTAYSINSHVKSIVKTKDLLGIGNTPHNFNVNGALCNANAIEILNSPLSTSPCFDNVVINHYFTKSFQDWLDKLHRGKADTADELNLGYKKKMFFDVSQSSKINSDVIRQFSAQLQVSIAGDKTLTDMFAADRPKDVSE